MDYAEWTGVTVSTLLSETHIKPEAEKVIFHGLDGYDESLSLKTAQRDDVFLAYEVNGQVLLAGHGFPLRLVAGDALGNKWVKWVVRIEVA
ncbi:molybdopterin-dependent oxidoreductase [Chloroflexota bacterium]